MKTAWLITGHPDQAEEELCQTMHMLWGSLGSPEYVLYEAGTNVGWKFDDFVCKSGMGQAWVDKVPQDVKLEGVVQVWTENYDYFARAEQLGINHVFIRKPKDGHQNKRSEAN